MTTKLDPRAKLQIKHEIWAMLYEQAEAQFKKRLDSIILKNAVRLGSSHASFVHKTEFYTCDTNPPPKAKNRLMPELIPEMRKYLEDQRQLVRVEMPVVTGYIHQVLNSTDHFPDYLRLFPDALHRPVRAAMALHPTCGKPLSDQGITEILERNAEACACMKQRMVTNLII